MKTFAIYLEYCQIGFGLNYLKVFQRYYLSEVKMIKVKRLFHRLELPDEHEKVEFELEMEFGKYGNTAYSLICSFVLKVRDLPDCT